MRALLATDRPSLGAALSLFLSERDVDVVGVVGAAGDVCARAAAACADVVLVDWHMGSGPATEVVADLKAASRTRAVIVLWSMQDWDPSLAPPADGFAIEGDPPEALLDLIRSLHPATA